MFIDISDSVVDPEAYAICPRKLLFFQGLVDCIKQSLVSGTIFICCCAHVRKRKPLVSESLTSKIKAHVTLNVLALLQLEPLMNKERLLPSCMNIPSTQGLVLYSRCMFFWFCCN